LWEWIFRIAIFLNLKNKEATQNWLSSGDIKTYLNSAGFETTRQFRKTIFPVKWIFIGPLLNWIFTIIPLLDFLKLDQYLIARATKEITCPKSLTICITVRDEKENIEPIVKMLPEMTREQEILFVEGLSVDGTEEEIKRLQDKYPEKNVRLLKELRSGQVHAIKKGFQEAAGDIIILFEGDGTSDPEDVRYFYDAMNTGCFEFIEGSRFVYPLSSESMPFLNKTGNVFFAKWFSMILNQRITDTLSGIKAMYKKDFDTIYKTWGFTGISDPFGDFELLYGSARYGLKIGEIPMKYRPRTYGQRKTKIFFHGFYLLKMAFHGSYLFRK
jgi:glycosyltransferase involved in cell wall biosynthesis